MRTVEPKSTYTTGNIGRTIKDLLTFGTGNPWIGAGTVAGGLGLLGYGIGPTFFRRVNPNAFGYASENSLRNRGAWAGALLGGLGVGIPALAANWDSVKSFLSGNEKKSGANPWDPNNFLGAPGGDKQVGLGTVVNNIWSQPTAALNPEVKLDLTRVVGNVNNGERQGLVSVNSLAKGLMGYGMGSTAATMVGAMLGLGPQAQERLDHVGGWAGALYRLGAFSGDNPNVGQTIGTAGALKLMGF